jgi:hypothetical protein
MANSDDNNDEDETWKTSLTDFTVAPSPDYGELNTNRNQKDK